jgi:hypothetical protein
MLGQVLFIVADADPRPLPHPERNVAWPPVGNPLIASDIKLSKQSLAEK